MDRRKKQSRYPQRNLMAAVQLRISELPLRHKFAIAFGGLILLMMASLVFTLIEITAVGAEAEHVIEHRQKSAVLFQSLNTDINLATTHLTAFLLTGESEFEEKYKQTEDSMLLRVNELDSLLANSEDHEIDVGLDELKDRINSFRDYGATLVRLRRDNNINYPGIDRATQVLNPTALSYMGLINQLLDEEVDGSVEKKRKVARILSDMRYSWAQMMNSLRMYFNQGNQRDIDNFRNYADLNGKLQAELADMDVEIGFDGVQSLGSIRKEYMAATPEIIGYRNSDEWRRDVFIMKSELTTKVVGKMRNLINDLVEREVHASQDSGKHLTQQINRIILITVVLVIAAVMLGAVFSVNMSQGILLPITRLMSAARQVADGDLNAEVFVTSNDEIGRLGRSFNRMIEGLRDAERHQQDYMEELYSLNMELESRVEKRTEELEKSETRIRTILENMGEGILVIDAQGFLESVNPAAEKIFNLQHDQISSIHRRTLIHGESAEISEREAFLANEERQPIELTGCRSGGETFPMELVVTNISLGNEPHQVCIVRDITSRKETEDRLQDAQSQLLDAAHKSGMAEMATGVLHNIGNILNSVNVSVEEVARIARTSKVTGLEKANDLIQENMADLAHFIVHDGKGRKLPEYLLKVGNIVKTEMEAMLNEAVTLREKVTMMKDVISTQQAYAHSGFYSEEFQIEPLIKDALKVQQASLRKWGVSVHTDIQPTPNIIGQKSKLLQVITNLIKNAKEAMLDNDIRNRPKEMEIRVGLYNNRSVYISVRDNGCGIIRDNLDKIFNHGFTTKEAGHGFGLHASANAMTEMGGSLTAHSDGESSGAIFTVSIPLAVGAGDGEIGGAAHLEKAVNN